VEGGSDSGERISVTQEEMIGFVVTPVRIYRVSCGLRSLEGRCHVRGAAEATITTCPPDSEPTYPNQLWGHEWDKFAADYPNLAATMGAGQTCIENPERKSATDDYSGFGDSRRKTGN